MGGSIGAVIGATKGDTRRLDYSPCGSYEFLIVEVEVTLRMSVNTSGLVWGMFDFRGAGVFHITTERFMCFSTMINRYPSSASWLASLP